MLRQHGAAEWINLAERHRLEPARAFEAKREAADAGKEVEYFHPRNVVAAVLTVNTNCAIYTTMNKNTVLTTRKASVVPDEMEQDGILHMRVSTEILRKLDNLRKAEDDLPSRSEMVRRLIEAASAAREKKGGR